MQALLIAFLVELLGLLGKALGAFIVNSQAAGLDPNTVAVIKGYVESAESNTALKTGDDKWQWVFDRSQEYFLAEGKVFVKSVINTAIEALVQGLPSRKLI